MTNKKQRKSTRLTTILKSVLVISTILLLCAAIYGVYLTKQAEFAVNQAHEKIDGRENSSKRDGKVQPLKDNLSILLIGVDDSEVRQQGADASRSDALMLATLNNKSKTVKLVSIPRDAYVYIPAAGYQDKITHSHSLGGALSTIETVEELFDVPVDYYVRMNFNAFIDVVNALDGVEVTVPYELLEKDEFDRTAVHLMPGKQTLNGSEALAFARTRKQDTDVDRGKRQQELVQAIVKKAASMESVLKYDDVMRAVGSNMKTDLTFSEIKSFLYYLSKGMPQIDTLTLEGEDENLPEGYYYIVDETSRQLISEKLRKHLGLPVTTSTELENNTYQQPTT